MCTQYATKSLMIAEGTGSLRLSLMVASTDFCMHDHTHSLRAMVRLALGIHAYICTLHTEIPMQRSHRLACRAVHVSHQPAPMHCSAKVADAKRSSSQVLACTFYLMRSEVHAVQAPQPYIIAPSCVSAQARHQLALTNASEHGRKTLRALPSSCINNMACGPN